MPTIMSAQRSWKYFRNLILFALMAVLFAVMVVVPFYDVYRTLHPVRFPIGTVSPADLGLAYDTVELRTEDGLTLRGWYVPSANRAAVILVHAYSGNRTGTLYHAALLAKHGYGVLLYDTRTQGESDGGLYAMSWDAHYDVFAALDYLKTRVDVDPKRIGILGLSAGAKISLSAAAKTDRIAAVVAEGCAYPTFDDWFYGTDPPDRIWTPYMWMVFSIAQAATGIRNPMPMKESVERISPTPVLLIAAGRDRLYNKLYFDAAKEPKESWFRDEPGHIDALFAHPEEYEKRVIGFLDRSLLPAPPSGTTSE
jgi:hypothetical protein